MENGQIVFSGPTNDIFVYDGDSVSLFDTICDADAKLHIRELALYARVLFSGNIALASKSLYIPGIYCEIYITIFRRVAPP